MPCDVTAEFSAELPSQVEADAPALMDQIADEPSLDELMARAPDHFTPDRRRALIARLRSDRAAWQAKISKEKE